MSECKRHPHSEPIDLGVRGNVHYYKCKLCGWGWGEWLDGMPTGDGGCSCQHPGCHICGTPGWEPPDKRCDTCMRYHAGPGSMCRWCLEEQRRERRDNKR